MPNHRKWCIAGLFLVLWGQVSGAQGMEQSRVVDPTIVVTNQRGDSAGSRFTIIVRKADRPAEPIGHAQYAVLTRSIDSVRYQFVDAPVDSSGRHINARILPGVYEIYVRGVNSHAMQIRVRIQAQCASTLEVYMKRACSTYPCLSELAPARAIYSTCDGAG